MDNSLCFDSKQVLKCLKSLTPPPRSLMEINSSKQISPFEHFLLRFFDQNPSDDYASFYFQLLNYLSPPRFNIISPPFLHSLNNKQNIRLISKFPKCTAVYKHLMELLYSEELFLIVFQRLFEVFNDIPSFLLPFFNKCLRSSLESRKNQPYNNIDVLLSIVFNKPKDPYPAVDFFFSAFLTDITMLPAYFRNTEKIRFFQEIQKVDVLPLSYLNFLSFSNTKCKLSRKQLWSFYIQSPSITFDYIDSYDFKDLREIWQGLLEISYDSNSIDDQIQFYMGFVLVLVLHPSLIPLFKHVKLQNLVDRIKKSAFISYKEIALISIVLLLCRINENVANELISIPDLNLSHLISFSASFDLFIEYFIWVLNPSTTFPLSDVYFTNMKENLSYLPLTTYIFSSHILPALISSLLRIGVKHHRNEQSFMKLVNTINHKYQWERYPYSLLLGIADESLMNQIIPLISENEIYFNLVKYSLSISCISGIFSQVYEKLAHDDEKLLRFFLGISTSMPLVNDFIRIDNRHSLPLNCMKATITMWIRFLSCQALILEVAMEKGTKVHLRKERNTLQLGINDEISKIIQLNSDIDNWHFLCISIKSDGGCLWDNLQRISLGYHFGQSAFMSIGSIDSNFDLQSLNVFRRELSSSDICKHFALGPNYKRFLQYQTFYSEYEKESLYVSPNRFISSLYLPYHKAFNSEKIIIPETFSADQLFDNYFDFSISPPFNTLFVSKQVLENSKKILKTTILQKRFYFESFFNSLEMHGGISLLIHFLSYIILKKKELHSLAFAFFSTLINRFPFIHYYFVKNHVYKLIGDLLWKSSPDPKTISNCAMVFQANGCIITNAAVIQYWFLGPSFFNCEYHELVQTILRSFEGENKDENRRILEKANAFETIIQSISTSKKHSEQFLSGIMALALNITTPENAKTNAEMIKNYLLANHFNKQEDQTKSTVSLLHLLNQIFSRYDIKNKISLRSLIPIFIDNASPVLCSLYDLMIKYSKIDDHMSLIAVLTKLKPNSQFASFVFGAASQFCFHNNARSFDMFYSVTIALLYLVNQDGSEDFVTTIVTDAVKMFENFQKFHSYLFNHLLLLLYFMYKKRKMVTFFGSDKTTNSSKITPFCHFLTSFLLNSILKNQSYELAKTFIYAFATLDNGEYSILLIAHIFDSLFDINLPSRLFTIVACDLLMLLPQLVQSRPQFVPKLVTKICGFFDYFINHDIIQSFEQFLNSICYKSTEMANSIKPIVKNFQAIRNLVDYPQIIEIFEFPVNVKTKIDQKKYIDYFANASLNLDKIFLTVYCNAVEDQTKALFSLSAAEEENYSVFEQWKKIFTELNFPSSYIYTNCPVKYGIDNLTTNYHIRRVLTPLNPSFDIQYKKYWISKYNQEEPKPKLSLSDVFDGLQCKHSNDAPFTCEVCQLKGISIVKGAFIVKYHAIQFYTNDDLLIFPKESIRAMRFTNYHHQPIGLFIEMSDMNSYLFAFETASIKEAFVYAVKKKFNIPVIKTIDLDYLIKKITPEWCAGKISNFDYLMYLNFLSGRTFSDFTQYLIFPWVCTNFSTDKPDLRNFGYPFFAQKEQQRHACSNYYKITTELEEFPHDYSNYVSNVGTALYFMVRLEPFTTEEIEFQGGKLDETDRTFQSFTITTDIMLSPGSKTTFELIPEAYFLPEFLENVNQIQFPLSQFSSQQISNVILPHWTKNSADLNDIKSTPNLYPSNSISQSVLAMPQHPTHFSSSKTESDLLKPQFFDEITSHQFIRKMRKLLESKQVSEKIHEWIDLIWGVRRTGELAHERFNLLPQLIFEFDQNEYADNISLLNAFHEHLHNCGQAPAQLFFSFHPKKEKFNKKLTFNLNAKFELHKPRKLDQYGFDLKLIDTAQSQFDMTGKSILLQSGIRISINEHELLKIESTNFHHYINFSNEIQPILICTSKNFVEKEFQSSYSNAYDYGYLIGHHEYFEFGKCQFLTSHKTPFLNHWYYDIDKSKLKLLSTLRGHNQRITSIALNSIGRTAFAGHIDGTISSFRLFPHLFLRTFRCKRMMPISKIAVMFDNSSLLVIQNQNMDDYYTNEAKKKIENESDIQLSIGNISSGPGSFLTLFSINGEFLKTCKVDDNIKDVVLTSFDNGYQTNYAILLTESSTIYVYSMNSLKRKFVIDAREYRIEMIYLKSNTKLFALTKSKALLKCKLFHEND